jgi:hypothetical protein
MAGIAIVAIPEQDDPVWKVSSEKVPHLTLLYLEGPLDNEENTIRFIQHAAKTSLKRFGLSVDRRGILGADNADVVFLDKRYGGKELLAFRGHLLTNTSIRTAYDKAEQYPIWTPHVTLGFPATPANKVDEKLYWINFDRIAVWTSDYVGPEFLLEEDRGMEVDVPGAWSEDNFSDFLEHFGVRGMKWGVRRDERQLSGADRALNISQRSQVKVASAISALAAVGMSTNAAAAAFQLQDRFQHYKTIRAMADAAANNPFLSDAAREGLRATKNQVFKGLVESAILTTGVTLAIGVVTQRTAKAYFAPMHYVYGNAKPKINSDLKKLSKDIKKGKRSSLTAKQYNAEVSNIVRKHMTADKKNLLSPFHELARSQLGTEYDTKKMDVSFSKLPNTDLYSKMTVTTPDGLKLVKAVKTVEHVDEDNDLGDVDFYFDYKFDSEGFVEDWSCPTIEIANDLIEGAFDFESTATQYGGDMLEQSESLDDFLAHFGVRGMKWGVRRSVGPDGRVLGRPPGLVKKSGGKSDDDSPDSQVKIKRGSGSADHQRMVKNLDKKIENLSTADIKAISARIKAINDLKATTAAEKAAKASMGKKLVKWALSSVRSGVDEAGSTWLKEVAKTNINEFLPDAKKLKFGKRTVPPTVKKAASNAKAATTETKSQPTTTTPPDIQNVVGKVINTDAPPAPKTPERQLAIETLARQIERAKKED